MIEFGEKLRQARERKGYTQQTLANHLYVTRQAVSRWECGARYPELLTAKKIAAVLDVSLDELLSGEEFRPQVNDAPVFEQPAQRRMQTLLYTFAAIVLLQAAVFAFLGAGELLRSVRSGTLTMIALVGQVNLLRSAALSVVMLLAAVWSLRQKLTPSRTAAVAVVYHALTLLTRWVSALYMVDSDAAPLRTFLFVFTTTAAQVGCIAVIALYFFGKRLQNPIFVYVVAVLTLIKSLFSTIQVFMAAGIQVGTLSAGMTTLAIASYCILLIAQARVLERKRLRLLS